MLKKSNRPDRWRQTLPLTAERRTELVTALELIAADHPQLWTDDMLRDAWAHREATAPRSLYACPGCGQTDGRYASVCYPCRERERAPQGEPVRLFEPAPTQLPGQLGLT